MPAPTLLASGIALTLLAIAGTASAAQLDYTLELGAEHSSNVNLSDTDPVSQNLLIPRLAFTFDQSGSTVQARAVGQIEYRDYLGGAFNNEFRGQLAGALNWIVVPQRLAFSVTDSSSVQPVDTLVSNTPGNLQQVNVLSAGPVLSFRLGETLRGQTELRYTDTSASKTKDFDSQRELGAVRLLDDLNATDQLSGNIEAEHVDIRHANGGLFSPSYDRYNVYGRYQSKLAHAQIDAALGWSKFAFGNGQQDQSGTLARARIDWEATSRSTFELELARQFTDTAEDLMVDPDQIGNATDINSINNVNITPGTSVVTPDVYLEHRIDVSYAFQGDRLGLRIAPFYRRARYVNDPTLDQDGRGAVLDLNYRLRPLLTLGFSAGGERVRYSTIDRRDDTYSYGPHLNDQMTQHWSWRLDLTRNQRRSTAPGRGYSENIVFFALSYQR